MNEPGGGGTQWVTASSTVYLSVYIKKHCALSQGSAEVWTIEGRAEMLVNGAYGGIAYFAALLNVTAWQVCIKKTKIKLGLST